MDPLPGSYINLLEVKDRRCRITTTGTEIVTTFYCEPASAAPLVISALLGRVTGNSQATYARELPAADHDFPYCYCVEAHPVTMDPRQATGTASILPKVTGLDYDDIRAALAKPINLNGPQSLSADGKSNDATPTRGYCGIFIEAIYRPLLSRYKTGSPWDATPEKAFDYVDPQFSPCSKAIPISASCYVLYDTNKWGSYGTSIGSSPQLVETWQNFTIRRVMCPTVPWNTIRQLANRINGLADWTPMNFDIPGLPNNTFPKGTLRFDFAEPISRIVPTCLGSTSADVFSDIKGNPITKPMMWWDIVLTFSWRTTFAPWTDSTGAPNTAGQISWNCDWFDGQRMITAPILGNAPAGWYESGFWSLREEMILGVKRARNHSIAKYLNAEDPLLPIFADNGHWYDNATHPFDTLFMLGAP
jgi:hypothetical protein